jgi:hypothetical protein
VAVGDFNSDTVDDIAVTEIDADAVALILSDP